MQITKKMKYRILMCIVINILLIFILYRLPIETGSSICIYKNLTGKECYNCGMTRAFLSILHLDFHKAMEYNWKVIIVFPAVVILYWYYWIKFIIKKENVKKKT